MLSTRLPPFLRDNYEFYEWKHASAILSSDFADEWNDILGLLSGFRLKKSWLTVGGGNKSQLAHYVDEYLSERGWVEKQFQTAIVVDGHRIDSPTHKIDCFKNSVALELEWNTKTHFLIVI